MTRLLQRRVCAGVSISTLVRAQGQGTPIVLLHGFTGNAESMAGLAARLPDDAPLVVPDLVGHGKSDAPDDPALYAIEACVAQLCALFDQLEISRARLVGYSMGGRVALALAALAPERVESVAVVGAHTGIADAGAREERIRADEALADQILREGVPAFVDDWMARPIFASQRRLGVQPLSRAREQRLANRAEGLALSLRAMGAGAQPVLTRALASAAVPVCFVVGAEDRKFLGIARELQRQIPASSVVVVPEAGHAAHLENPAVLATALADFWRRNPMNVPSVDWKNVRDYEDIRFERSEDGIAKITINRPEVRNAFRPKTVSELIDAFARVREDPTLGVVLLTGEGGEAFCAGGDQRVRGDAGYVDDSGVARLNVLDLQKLIRSMPKPVIALVAGYAIGGGHVLHVVCDLTIAADNARFGQTGPKVGSFDGGFGSSYLARIIGQKKAREIWYLCRQYDARQAEDMGLVNEVVPLQDLEATGVQWAREILQHSPIAIRCLKSAFNADCDGQVGLQELAGNATMLFYMSEEAKEGRDAFVEKRSPDFGRFPWRP